MTSERWEQVKEILDALEGAPERSPDRRAALARYCGDDLELRREVESFLRQEDAGIEEFLARPLFPIHRESLALGRRIGHYKLRGLLGRGGMGDVYRAVREDDYEQRVAVKLIRWRSGRDEDVRRFHTERQILARLEHPNIARLLDGGTTEDGVPYLVMEYVEGEPIDRYCDAGKLPVRERLGLFRQVCSAVQFAHQSLVVHRDLKPGNILVTAAGVPKLLDFGIAKLLDPESAARGLTRDRLPMTLEYASPEMILGEPITTASDIYALGVLLYQLLTGRLPCHLEGCSPPQAVVAICRKEPQKPSTAVRRSEELRRPGGDVVHLTAKSVSGARDGDPRKLRRRLAGDVDAIVLMALRKEPRHRYGSAEQLSEDIRRHLEGRPVLARKSTTTYRAGKFVRRNKLHLATASVLLSLLIAGATTRIEARRESERAEREAVRAAQEAQRADRESGQAKRLSDFLENLFTDLRQGGRRLTAEEILDRGMERVEAGMSDEPELYSTLLEALGRGYRTLGFYDKARRSLEASLGIRREHYPENHPELARGVANLAFLLYNVGVYEEAEKLFREALAIRRKHRHEKTDLVRAMSNLAACLMRRGSFAEAEELYRGGLAIRVEVNGPDHPYVATSLRNLGLLHYVQGNFEEAESLLRDALEIRLSEFGPRHSKVAKVRNILGRVLFALGNRDEAELHFQEALAIRREVHGDDHLDTADSKRDLALLLLEEGHLATAEVLLNQALQTIHTNKPEGDWEIAFAEYVLGALWVAQGRYGEAEPCLVGSYRIFKSTRGEQTVYTRDALNRILELYENWGKPRELAEYRAAASRHAARRPSGESPGSRMR